MTLNIDEIAQLKKAIEDHAYSVRQLIGQRSRLKEVIKAVGSVACFDNGQDLSCIFDAMEASPSQFLSDIFCLILNRAKKNGFFVEFGACDGRLINNTWVLEKKFGWTGILSEPMRDWHEVLSANRSCIIDHRCVWTESGALVQFAEFEGDEYQTESSILSDKCSPPRTVSAQYSVETITLSDLLACHKAPKEIDFLSIDIEGGEYDIISQLPLEQYRFGFICVEQKNEEAARIRDLLRGFGYMQVFEEASGYDGFYIPASPR